MPLLPLKFPNIFGPDLKRDTLSVIETLSIGAIEVSPFSGELPGGLISGAMIAVGIAAISGRPMGLPDHGAHHPDDARTVTRVNGLASDAGEHGVVPCQHCDSRRFDILRHVRQQPVSAAHSRLGSHLRPARRQPGRPVPDHHAGKRKGADVAGIAVVQTMRVIILTAALPMILATFGLGTHGGAFSRAAPASRWLSLSLQLPASGRLACCGF